MRSSRHALVGLLASLGVLVGGGFGCQATCEERLDCGPYAPEPSGAGVGGAGGAHAGGGGAPFGGSSAGGGAGVNGGIAGVSAGGESWGGSAGAPSDGVADTAGGDAGDGGGAAAPCDASRDPRSERCLVDERFAVFASPGGDDDATGTRAAPVRTLERALALARASERLVVACTGVYDEALRIGGDAPARLHGGFDCERDWLPVNERSVVAPDEGPALRVDSATGAVVIEDFELRAPDASEPGASSVGAIIADSNDVTIRRARVVAGRGMNGATGETVPYEFPERSELQGPDATATSGGAGDVCACPGGGAGARGGGGAVSEDGAAGLPDHPGAGGKAGDAASSCTAGGAGLGGAAGPDAPHALGASRVGEITRSGWVPAAGETGLDGAPGQGGGGGSGQAGGSGGSGGCGGCGGRGGPGVTVAARASRC